MSEDLPDIEMPEERELHVGLRGFLEDFERRFRNLDVE